jgi:hypothetical protein
MHCPVPLPGRALGRQTDRMIARGWGCVLRASPCRNARHGYGAALRMMTVGKVRTLQIVRS